MPLDGLEREHHLSFSYIDNWLSQLPNPFTSVEGVASSSQRTGSKRKRGGHEEREGKGQPQRKSRRLQEISGNRMKRKSPEKQENERGDGPSKRMMVRKKPSDLDETPRAKTQSRSAAPYDGQAEDTPTRPTDPSYILRPASLISNASPKRSEMSSTTTKSSKQSSRSRSPQKSLAATERSTVPISLGHVLIGKNHMDTKTLMRDVYDLFRGRKDSIPRELETRVEEADLLLLQDEETDSNLVEPEVDAQTPESQFSDAYKICKITRECIEENVPEARWNGDVHYRLLRLALEGQWQSKGIWFGDITRAQITQKSLIPLMDKKLVELKMVDLAMMIKSDKKLKNRIIARLNRQLGEDSSKYQDCTPSINCTTADYLRYRPIAVSIETKKETDVTDPNLQIGVWSRAHLLKLRQLMPTDVPPPVMPVLSAVGSRWRMTFAQLQLDNQSATVAEIVQGKAGAELVLGTPWLEIGASTSVKGVFQIVATLQRLAQWIHEEYKPWFEKNVFQDQI